MMFIFWALEVHLVMVAFGARFPDDDYLPIEYERDGKSTSHQCAC